MSKPATPTTRDRRDADASVTYGFGPLSISEPDRVRPGKEFIERMRTTFPIEREMDKMLTRKMEHRAAPAYAGASLERMTEHLTAFLNEAVEGPYRITDQRWFAGGASKIQMGYTLHWNAPGRGPSIDRMVVRMEPSESVNATSRAREFQLLKAFEGVVPVPKAFWVDAEAKWFPEPALLYSFCEGITKPRATASGRLAGIGTNFGPDLRARLAPQFVRHLATIHTHDRGSADMSAFEVPAIGSTESALKQLGRARRVWEEDRTDDLALAEVASNWLARNAPILDKVSVVHGDYRSGNFLFDEHSLEITAVLDWERGYLGDRHRDLAWTANHAFGHVAEDGKTFLASGLITPDELFETYEKLSGLSVDPARLRYYTILNSYQLVVSAVASAQRVANMGKTHQDILLASAVPVGYIAAEQLRKTLEELL